MTTEEPDVDGEELERLRAENAALKLETTATRTLGKGVFGAGAMIAVGPNLFKAFRGWLKARSSGNPMPIDETARLGAAVVKRLFSVGLIRLGVVLLPVALLFWQNLLLSKQNDAFARDTDIARRAQLITTLYDTDCSSARVSGRPEEEAPDETRASSIEVKGENSSPPEDEARECPPRADPRSRAEAAKALYRLDHPEPSFWGRIKGRFVEETSPVITDLSGAELGGVNLEMANFRGAKLAWANLERADLRKTKLAGADLQRANLQNAELQRTNLRGAKLWWTDLQRANLQSAELGGADLREAKLQRTDLRGAKLRAANLQRANLQSAELGGADLREADLQRANLQSAELGGADLREAKLQRTDLRGARLRFADLRGASLEGTNLEEAELQFLRWSEIQPTSEELKAFQERLNLAIGNAETLLPPSLEYPCSWSGIRCETGAMYGNPIRVRKGGFSDIESPPISTSNG